MNKEICSRHAIYTESQKSIVTHHYTQKLNFWQNWKHFFGVLFGHIPRKEILFEKIIFAGFWTLRSPNFVKLSKNPNSRFGEKELTDITHADILIVAVSWNPFRLKTGFQKKKKKNDSEKFKWQFTYRNCPPWENPIALYPCCNFGSFFTLLHTISTCALPSIRKPFSVS